VKVAKLHSTAFLNYPEQGPVSYITNKAQLKVCHCHDYYEIFLVDQGYGEHQINYTTQHIDSGFLCFIHPRDVHYYNAVSDNFRIINIIITENLMTGLFDFLGIAFRERFLLPDLPPSVHLDHTGLTTLIRELEQLILYKKIMKPDSGLFYRITLFNILTRYFPVNPLSTNHGKIPQWLRWLSLEMLKVENFTRGLPALYQLSGKTQEHLSRCCKKYLNKTPSQLVNTIRLEYSAKLLVSTDMPIVEISESCGFESLSYFYHRFKESYGFTPREFRMKGKEEQIYLMGDLSVQADIPDSIPLEVGMTDREQ
jgi:AraC family cel operon transcriptional repressor